MITGLEVRVPFFRPLWRRLLVVGLALAWAGVEVSSGAWVWAGLFGAAALYLIWAFFLAFEDGPAGREEK